MDNKKNLKDLTPAMAIHPGELLKDELEARKISAEELGALMGFPEVLINCILTGKMGIKTEVAELIGKALNMDPQIWLNAQANYEADVKKISKIRTPGPGDDGSVWEELLQYMSEEAALDNVYKRAVEAGYFTEEEVSWLYKAHEKGLLSPPGDTIQETMEWMGMDELTFSQKMGIDIPYTFSLIIGQSPITPDIAKRLEAVLKVDAQFWLNSEKNYQEKLAKYKENGFE